MSEKYSHSKHLSAEEIQAYLKAELSEQEMHSIERHLLECEFCSEAMEGYETAISTVEIPGDIINLNKRIDKRTSQKKKKGVFPIFRIAAIALALIVSAIFITNYFVEDIKNPEFSEKKVEVKEEVEELDGEEEGEVNGKVKGEVNEREVNEGAKGEKEVEEVKELESDANYSAVENSFASADSDVLEEETIDVIESTYYNAEIETSEIVIVASKQERKSIMQSGRLRGTIIDSLSNEPIPFAMVSVISGESVIAGTTTDFDGKYDFKDVISSDYTIEVSSVGYTKKLVIDTRVNSEKITFLDVQMTPGNDLEAIDVVAYSVPLIDKDGGSSGGTVTSEDISKMPLRDATSVSGKVAGVETSSKKRTRLKKSKRRASNARFGSGIEDDSKNNEVFILKGSIKDQDKEELVYVTIINKNKNSVVFSGLDGNYTIEVEEGDTLVFKYIGFKNELLVVGNKKKADISMDSRVEINEIIVLPFSSEIKDIDAYPSIGYYAYEKYLSDSLVYPTEALINSIKGIILVQFTLNSNGEMTSFSVLNSLGFGCDEEAIRLIKEGPAWISARKNGITISSSITVLVNFE